MKSRITIEVNFEDGNRPVIQIVSRKSDDVRDNLIQAFYQTLGESSWCKIRFQQDVLDPEHPENNFKRIYITPIPSAPSDSLKEEAGIMLEQARVWDQFYGKPGEAK